MDDNQIKMLTQVKDRYLDLMAEYKVDNLKLRQTLKDYNRLIVGLIGDGIIQGRNREKAEELNARIK